MPQPVLEIFNHQDAQPVHLDLWHDLTQRALPLVLAAAKSPDAPLHQLEEIEISLVSDDTIAKLHGDFMADPTPTDVITFHHGEIFISLDTAQRQAAENTEPYGQEVARYIVHGLLHLAGWDDRDETERKAMHEVQERILAS